MDQPRTKLVCTIGPASVGRVRELIDAGMNVARINFSHGTPEQQRAAIQAVRAAAREQRKTVAVLADLPGPKIRLGTIQDHRLELQTGATFRLQPPRGEQSTGSPASATGSPASEAGNPTSPPTGATSTPTEATPATEATETATATDATETEAPTTPPGTSESTTTDATATESTTTELPVRPAVGDASGASVSISGLAQQLQPGDRILLADGAAELRVAGTEGDDVLTEVVRGGVIRTRSGVNVPSERLTGPALTDEDRAAIPRALELRADLIALSFVRTAEDVTALRALLPEDGPPVVAKIETRQAVDNFDEIVKVVDGVMVARGDLGVDLPFENVPLVQKRLLRGTRQAGGFSIVATQMLESMTSAARPTRAEVSDVANAVLDGADAVMLSGETAIGAYPVEATAAMASICAATERDAGAELRRDGTPWTPTTQPEAIVRAAVALTDWYPEASAIWCFTRTGRTAEMLSLLRPRLPIVAFTPAPVAARRLCPRNAVVPVVLSTSRTGEPLIKRMEQAARQQGLLRPDGPTSVVLLTTSPQPEGVNRLELHQVAARP